jgi:hypothetical protein
MDDTKQKEERNDPEKPVGEQITESEEVGGQEGLEEESRKES